MMRLLAIAVTLAACCPPAKPTATPHTGSGSAGSGSGSGQGTVACEAARGKVTELYRAEAQAKEPKRVDDATADNVAMVMADCAKAPDKVGACLAGAQTTTEIETKCLAPLDEEGTEGDDLANHH